MINKELIKLARKAVRQKVAFQPPEGDPAQGGMPPGAPPMDPSMMPPGGDPSMMGGMPPMPPGAPMPPPGDPMAAAGGAPMPGGGGLTADSIRAIIKEEMAAAGAGGGVAGAGGPGAAGKPVKVDINTVASDIFQVQKLILTMFSAMGLQMPQDILDGPNRDATSGMPVPQGTPGSTSDPNKQAPPLGPQGGGD